VKRDKQKEIKDVEELWKEGMDGARTSPAVLGLARAAGFEAYPVLVSIEENILPKTSA